MCGRYNITDMPGLQDLLDELGVDLQLPEPRYNLAPTETVPLIHDGIAEPARWWLTPSWSSEVNQKYSMFNARAESLSKSKAFRGPFKSQRGIMPMSSFIEWRTESGIKQPWLITNSKKALAVAALWDIWRGGKEPLLSCTVVTTEAASEFYPWHHRMPVMLSGDECRRWLDNSSQVDPDDPLFAPTLKYGLTLTPINRASGNSRNKTPETMAPTGEPLTIPR